MTETIDNTTQYKSGLKQGSTLQSGKYTIQKTLGQGGFGITYLAKMVESAGDCEIEVDVAVKEFYLSRINTRLSDGVSLESTQSPDFIDYREKFRKEAKKLSKLSKFDDIVKVFDVFDENGTTYYAMEYIDGCNLDDYIRQKNRLSETQAIKYIKAIATALRHLHGINMVHLDLKPSNIMLSKNDKLYLIDFGLSKQYDDNGNPVTTTSNSIGGKSAGYAPIEQYVGLFNGVFAPTLDIYALGATFYKMLTGETPIESISMKDFSSLRSKLSIHGISTKTIGVIEKAMQRDRENRYQSVDEFLEALSDSTQVVEVDIIEDELFTAGSGQTILKPRKDKGQTVSKRSDSDVETVPLRHLTRMSGEDNWETVPKREVVAVDLKNKQIRQSDVSIEKQNGIQEPDKKNDNKKYLNRDTIYSILFIILVFSVPYLLIKINVPYLLIKKEISGYIWSISVDGKTIMCENHEYITEFEYKQRYHYTKDTRREEQKIDYFTIKLDEANNDFIVGSPITIKYVGDIDSSGLIQKVKEIELSENFKKLLGKWRTKDGAVVFEFCKNITSTSDFSAS